MLNPNLITAIKASIDAGKEIMNIYNSDFNYELKEDASPLTIADKNANAIINKYLVKTTIPIISEENAQIDFSIRKDWNTCWIVDPLDGTKEFIKRNGEFTVNIALVENGIPILGVIYVPVKKTLYFADVNKKELFTTTLISHNTSIDKIIDNAILVYTKNENSNMIRVVGSRSHMNIETSDFIDSLKEKYDEVEIVPKGSSLKFCLVAEGVADIYPRFAPTMEWDTAAAHAICKACGVSVISKETNKELSYNKEDLLNPWFIVNSEFILKSFKRE